MRSNLAARFVMLVALGLAGLIATTSCNPSTGTGVKVADNVGIRDYFTLRSIDGNLTTRDVLPEPRPREAITGDDYFQIKLEHIYIGDALGRDVGNLAIISEVEGVLPKRVKCQEMPLSGELGFDFDQRERNNIVSTSECAYKHIVSLNPVFANGHVTFDSAFITPPFRIGQEHIGLRFIMAQLNDVELARQLLNWGQEQLNNLSEWGLEELDLTQWQSKLVDIGFTLANYVLDYAAKPDYVFEFETDFVPIETVGGVTTPQNLFMGGDFVIAGFPKDDSKEGAAGALKMADSLVFDSGRLYWKATKDEFRDGPYIVFKVVRQSRYPGDLPIKLASISRSLERGRSADEVATMSKNIVLDLQDARILNETEGIYLKDLVAWFASARNNETALKSAGEGTRKAQTAWNPALQQLTPAYGADLSMLTDASRARGLMQELETLYDNYTRSPGMMQSECIVIRDVTQGIADNYKRIRPNLQRAFEDLQIARSELQRKAKRSAAEESKLSAMNDAEVWVARELEALPETLDPPKCPALRD